MRIRNKDLSDIVLMIVIYAVLLGFAAICLLPFVNVVAKSLSSEAAVVAGRVNMWPVDFQANAYKYVVNQKRFFLSIKNSVIVTVVGTALALLVNSMMGYTLARNRFKERRIVLLLIVFTMVFSAGVIPGYLMVRAMGLYDTLWALILPAVVSPYNMIIMKNFFESVPASLEEAAVMEGAGDIRIYVSVILPLSKPVLASMCLFFAVGYWNDIFRPMIFIMSQDKYTLQVYLRSILISTTEITNTLDPLVYGNVAAQSVQNATILLSIIPILLVYPFLQKYFAAGVRLGAVKE